MKESIENRELFSGEDIVEQVAGVHQPQQAAEFGSFNYMLLASESRREEQGYVISL